MSCAVRIDEKKSKSASSSSAEMSARKKKNVAVRNFAVSIVCLSSHLIVIVAQILRDLSARVDGAVLSSHSAIQLLTALRSRAVLQVRCSKRSSA